MKEKNVIGSLVLRKGIVAAIVVLLLGAGIIMLMPTKARTDPCVITGYVYEEDGVTPLQGATVRVRDEITGAWGENITDANGMYSITLGGGPLSPPWMEWFDGDGLLGTATYDEREGKAFRYIEASEIDQQGYMWLNITLGTPKTTKTVGEPEFIKYDYDDGEPNYGYLVSPIINVTEDVATLSFWTWWQIEGEAPAEYDLMNVYISTDGGYNWNLLTKPGGNPSATLNPAENPADGSEYNYYGSSGFNVTPSWVYETFDISAYVPNEIVIIFEFNTGDEFFNYWEGWYIDDIKITEFGGNVPFSDDFENGIGNWTYNGYWHISEHRSKSSSHAWYYGIEKSYVSSDTLFTLEAEGDYEAIYYRINGGDWIEYDGPFNLTEECEHYIEFYAENGSNSEPIHNQTHYVDNSAPVSNYYFGEPNSVLNYGGHNYTAIKICTPMIISAYDLPEGCAAGVEWLNYSVWWNPNEPNNYTKIDEVSVYDNDENDTDKRVGLITVELHFDEECFHEIKWQMVDYLGHASQQYSIDIAVDATAPTINKTIGEPKYVDEKGWLWVNCSTPFWFNITDSGCGGGVGVWKFGMNIYWNETRVPEGQQQLFTLVEQIVVVDNLAEITMELYNESYGTFIVNTATTELYELLTEPWGSTWYDEYGFDYEIIEWNDNGNGTLDYCDYIGFDNSQLIWHVENITIVVKDLNPEYGEISYLFHFCDLPEEYRECFHEPEIWAIDYVGNNYSFKEKDMVDCTPPTIYKYARKVVALEQTQMNTGSYTDISDYQSFKAPWSYIDAVSIYIAGTFDSFNLTYIEIYNDSNGTPGTKLAESEYIGLSGNQSRWLQFCLQERLYVEEGATYWIKLVYNNTQQPIKWEAQSNYPNAGPYPDGFAIVDGQANSSWDFTFKIEYYPVYPYMHGKMYSLYNETMIAGDEIENVAIFMDNNPWDKDSIQDVLDYYGISYDIYNSSDIGNVDLSQYDKVIIANDQTTSFYDAVEANLAWFEQYAFLGGQLEIHAADEGWHSGSWDVMPGGFTHVFDPSSYIDIAIPGHDVLVYPNAITDEELDDWGYSVHGYLTNLPENSEIVLIDNYSKEPVFVVTSWGNGCIIISTQTLEWAYAGYSKFLENVILYCPLYGYPYDYLHKTWVTSEAVLDLNSWDEGCMGGVGLKSLLYRIYVDETETWHPSSGTDTYCGNYNITYVDGAYWYVAKNSTVSFTKVKFHEECKHILQMRAEDYVGNIRIVNQTHYVDNSPPKLEVEYPPEHGFYYDEQTGKMFVRACKEFYLNLTDEPDCGVGWRDFIFYFRYEYTNFTTPYIEKHPVSMNDNQYGEVVNISGELWWKITPQTPSITLHFFEECYHKIYYFYNASDWLDNSIVSEVLVEEIYVDEFEPEVSKEHPWCYKEEESIYLHLIEGDNGDDMDGNYYEELYPEYGRKYYWEYEFEKDGNWYEIMYDEKYNVSRLYLLEPIAYTWYLYNETNDKYMYLVYYGENEPFENGSLWHELYPDYCNIYELVDYNDRIILKNQTGEESEWIVENAFGDYVTITVYIYNETNDKYMYIEYVGGAGEWIGSLWHEVYPEFSNYYISTSYNETTDVITLNNTKTGKASEWYVENVIFGDIKLKPVSYIRACDRINLTAKDMPDYLVFVDQFQTEGSNLDTLQALDSTPWPWDAQTFKPNASYINATALYLKWIEDVDVTVYIHDESFNVLATATKHLTGFGEDWIIFEFEPGISVTPNATYYIEAHGSPASAASWYFNQFDLYTRGKAWISGEMKEGYDWKFQIMAYMPNPCASGIEGIYYAYEIGWDDEEAYFNHHPMNETDAPHGEKIVNITQYYDWDEIEEYFNGYWLWYEYDENVGIHFYEECVHWLYYWAKDNVCHHTPVYMQVYEVDQYEPIVIKEHPEHGYYTPVEVYVNPPFANETYWLEGTFHVRDAWYWNNADGWKPNPSGQYTDKIQYINFTIYNNDMTHDLLLRLHVEEIVGDSGITLENGSDVNYKVYTINVPAGSSLIYTVNVYDNLEFLRWGVWSWWAEVENVTQYLRAGARINLSAYDVGEHPSGISNIYYRYEWNGSYYPVEGHPAAVNGSDLQPDVPEIANYWWFIYNDEVGIVFNEECEHDLYYFAKDRSCHNSTLHHQTYYVDASEPVIEEELPEHGAIGNTTTSLYEDFEAPFGNGWAVVNGDGSTWSIKSEEPLFLWQVYPVAYSGRYAAMAWTYNQACAWLITPKITIPEDGNLTFWYKVYYGGSAGLKVGINSVSSQTDTSAFVEVWDSGIFSDTMYRHVEIDLSAYAGQEVYIGFHCYNLSDSFPNNGLLIDDVWVGAIHRIETLLDDDVEDGYGWQIEDLKIQQTSYWMLVNRLPVASPPTPGWSETMPNKPAVWCGDLSLGNAPNGGGRYACNWNDTLTMKNPVNLSGVTGIVNLSFNIWRYLDSGDYLYVEASNDSINWTILETISGQSGWITKTVNISQYIGNSTVWIRFRFVSNDGYSYGYNGVFIDNVTIYNATQPFFLDYFNTLANWNALMLETSKWHITDYAYHSENHSWYCGVESSPYYLNCMNDALISQEIDLTAYTGKKAMLMFWHKYDMNADYDDRAYVEVYDGTWYQIAYYSGVRDWVQEFIDISGYIGKVIKIRFRFYSDYNTTDLGWFIDDIKLEIREVETAVFEDKFDMYKHTVASTAVPRFPPTDSLSEYGDWSRSGYYAGNWYYGWEQFVSPWIDGSIIDAAVVHGYYYKQEEYLYSPVIYDLPKFSNLTFYHYFERTYAYGYVWLIDEFGTWHLLKSFTGDKHWAEEDISLWDYYGQDIQIVFEFYTPNGYGNYNTDYWAILWVDITSHGFLRACANITISAYDMPLNECAVGLDAIYWRYEYGEIIDGGFEDDEVSGEEIPGVTPEDEEIYNYDWWVIYDNGEYDKDGRVGYISFDAHLPENCTHDLYYFAKDKLCHSSELKHERWYVDGIAPETWLGISWAEHPWIPRNGPPLIAVAIYDSEYYPSEDYCSYWVGGEMNNYDEFYDVLTDDPEGRFYVNVITTLDYETLLGYDVLILPDNCVPDTWLDDVDDWFNEGKRIICGDSAVCFAAYSGYMWPGSAGSNGKNTYWDYDSENGDQKIALAHPITEDYTVGQIISSAGGDAQMYISKLPGNAVVLTISDENDSNAYVGYREVSGKGSIIVLGPYDTLYEDEYDLIRDACAWNITGSYYYVPEYYEPEDEKPEVICINDDVHFYANHYGEFCVYPYNWQNNTYYRWVWYNESADKYEFYPTPSTPGAINGSEIAVSSHADLIQFNDSEEFWFYEEPPFGGWIYWMHYEEPFYFTEGCEHWLYYFSKDDLCNTEEPVEWHVGVDDSKPTSNLEFEISNGLLYYNETSNVYYFQNCSWVIINTTDLPENPDCQTGVWYVNYTVWRWVTRETTVQLITNQVKKGTIYIAGVAAGSITDYIDSNGDGLWNYCDYMYIEWLPPYSGIYNNGWYHVESISFTGYYNVKVREVMGGAGEWQTLIPWTTAYEWMADYEENGIKYDKYYEYDPYYDEDREYFRIWIHLGSLVDFSCGKYEIHWQVYDYNNMTEGEKKQDLVIDCTPPRTKKEFEMPYVEQTIAGGETIHWVTNTTKIWLNSTDDFIWDSGVNEIWYQFWNEVPILLWKRGDETHNKHWFTVEEAVKIILNNPDATIEDYFNARPTLNKTIIEIYHWAVDNVGHVEDKQKSKQHIYIDYMPPTSRVDEIIPYEQEEIPFNVTVVEIEDHGAEISGPVGVCKVEVYYSYSENNITWSDWQLYTTFTIPYEQRLAVPDQTFSFNAPEGGGWYRFISIAYDCLGNKEMPPYYHGTYDAECFVVLDREPPEITKEYGEPNIEIELDGEIAHAITSNTIIYLNATDMPEENYVGLDKIYWSFGDTWYSSPSFNGARSGSISFTPEQFGLIEGQVYHLFFKASDMRGQFSEEMKQKFIIDNSPPTTTIVIGNNSTMPFSVTINANDEIAGVKLIKLYFRYSPDGESWTEWIEYGSYNGASNTWSFIYKPSEFCYYMPGYYQFYAYAEDNLGNAKSTTPTAEASCYVPPIPEDFNADGRVNVLDLYYIITNWFKDTSSPDWPTVQKYDLDGSGRIDAGDIYLLIAKWTG